MLIITSSFFRSIIVIVVIKVDLPNDEGYEQEDCNDGDDRKLEHQQERLFGVHVDEDDQSHYKEQEIERENAHSYRNRVELNLGLLLPLDEFTYSLVFGTFPISDG